MSSKRISLSAYKASKEAAGAPKKTGRRLGFGESVSTREARAQELRLELQVLGRLDNLLKRCGRDPDSAQTISNWLCAEGLEGHAKKGLSRILCHVKVWSRTLRAEGMVPKEVDEAEVKARAAFNACVCAIIAVDSLSYRCTEKSKTGEGENELVKTAGEVLVGMMEAIVGAGAQPRARGLHPTEHAQLSRMVGAWKKRGAAPSPFLQGIEKHLLALKSSDVVSSDEATGSTASSSREKNSKKRAAWVQVPDAAAESGSLGATPSALWDAGRLSPTRPSTGGAAAAPLTEVERNARLEATLTDLLARNVVVTGAWWAQAFQGGGPFPQGPEGCWSLQYQRANEDPGRRRNQGKGLLGADGDNRGEFAAGGVDLGSGKTEQRDGLDSDGAPSTPSTVPSEASPSPERMSPVPAVKTEGGTDLDAKPVGGSGENGTAVAVQEVKQAPQDVDGRGVDSKGGERKTSPKKRVLSKREQEEEDRRRRKEEARRAGKEKGKAKALERERLKKEREMQRQKMIAESRKKKAAEEAAKKEKEAKDKADGLARRSKAEEGQQQQQQQQQQPQHQHQHQQDTTAPARDRENDRKRDQPTVRGEATGESRRDLRDLRDSNRSKDRQDRSKDKERRDKGGSADGRGGYHKDVERNDSAVGRGKDESRRPDAPGESRGRSDKEDRARAKEADRASSWRDKDESRRYHDLGENREPSRGGLGRGHDDQHELQRLEDRGRGEEWRKEGPPSQRARELDVATDPGRRKLNSREREGGERKRRRSDPIEPEGMSVRHSGERRHDEHTEDDRNGSQRPSKKKSKKDKRERKDKRADRHADSLRPGMEECEESSRGRKRSRDFDAAPPLEGYAAVALQRDPPRRSVESRRHRSHPDLGRTGSELRDFPRQQLAGRSRADSGLSPRRDDTRDGSEKRARRSGGGGEDASSVLGGTGASRERPAARAGELESTAGASSSGGGGGGGSGLPGMEGYSSAASPPASLELGGYGKTSGGRDDHDRQGLGSLKMLDAYGPSLSRGSSPEGGHRRKGSRGSSPDAGHRRRGSGGRDSGARQRLAANGSSMDDDSRVGSRLERDHSERDRLDRDRLERDRLERDRLERDRSDRDRLERDRYERDSRLTDTSGRESSGRRGVVGSHPSSSSNARGSRRSAERGTQSTSARDGSSRWRLGDDSRGRPPIARDGRLSKSSGITGGRSASASHSSVGMGTLGMGMSVSIIGGTPVLMTVPKMMEVSAGGSLRGGERHMSGRLDDKDRDRDRHNGGGRREDDKDHRDDRWAGMSRSEDVRDRRASRSEDRGRRWESGASDTRRARADSRDEAQALAQASPQEDEPEEGELVIDPSTALPSPLASTAGRKSRWGNVVDMGAASSGTSGAEGSRSFAAAASSSRGGSRWQEIDEGRIDGGTSDRGEPTSGRGDDDGGGEDAMVTQDARRDTKSPQRSSSSKRGSEEETAAEAEEDAKSSQHTATLAADSEAPRGSADPAGAGAKATTSPARDAQSSSPKRLSSEDRSSSRQRPPTVTADEQVDPMESGNRITSPPDDKIPGFAKRGRERTVVETAPVEDLSPGTRGDGVSSGAGGEIEKKVPVHGGERSNDAGGAGAKLDTSEASGGNKKNPEADGISPAPAAASGETADAATADAAVRQRRRPSGDLAPFLRKSARRKPGEPLSPATSQAADATTATSGLSSVPQPNSLPGTTPPSDEGTLADSAAGTDEAKPQRASVFSRLGAPPSEAPKDAAKVAPAANPDRSSGTPEATPLRGLHAWGGSGSGDRALSRGTSGEGNNVGSTTADVSELTPIRRGNGGEKNDGRPVGGGAGRLMNAALSSSRDSGRSGKKGGASGRGRGTARGRAGGSKGGVNGSGND